MISFVRISQWSQNLFEAGLAPSEPAVKFMSPLLKIAYLDF